MRCFDIFTKWRVKSQNVSLSVAFSVGVCVCRFVFKLDFAMF